MSSGSESSTLIILFKIWSATCEVVVTVVVLAGLGSAEVALEGAATEKGTVIASKVPMPKRIDGLIFLSFEV
ncbi:MAG: hypothetical protein KIA58_04215 [Winkia neuii]|uniref:hypothetical protein n=1 Tax=Winkia neuii TaxID=33007 RepID=UPI00241D11C2|nr:hypothetical protein [Winkia neuii]MBS5947551.1 hypothetical protein [Winkia neuii]